MSSRAAHPFGQLLGIAPGELPRTASSTVVVQGQKITDVRQITALEDDPETAARLRAEAEAARQRQRYQRDRQDPEKMDAREAWMVQNREKRLVYQREWRLKNKERQRELGREWAKREYYADPEASRRKQRDYYAANREKILARLKAKRDAAKASKP